MSLFNDNTTDQISKLPEEVIEAGEHKFYWLDKDLEQGENHAPFRLSSDGEELALFHKIENDWELLDYISFETIESDISYGRVYDGADNWQYFLNPTPNSTNNILNIGLSRINDLLIHPNPSSSGIFKLNEYRSITVYNYTGQIIKKITNTDEIDISEYPKGLYILEPIFKKK